MNLYELLNYLNVTGTINISCISRPHSEQVTTDYVLKIFHFDRLCLLVVGDEKELERKQTSLGLLMIK